MEYLTTHELVLMYVTFFVWVIDNCIKISKEESNGKTKRSYLSRRPKH
jgi:hypothetical protein